jgi:cysteinyl-tRNA synthetase
MPLNLSDEALDQSRQAIRRLDECISSLRGVEDGRPFAEIEQLLYDLKTGFADAMDDDLNVSSAMATIFQVVRQVNRLIMQGDLDQAGARRITDAFKRVDAVLNIFEFEQEAQDEKAQELIAERKEARQRKDWELADQLRERLGAMGVEVKDKKST